MDLNDRIFEAYVHSVVNPLNESIKMALDSLKADGMQRKGKLIVLTFKDTSDSDKIEKKAEKALGSYMDKLKFVGASKKGQNVELEVEMK